MSYAARAFHHARILGVLVILLLILVALLFGSFSLLLPIRHWAVWCVPVLIAAGGAVALVTAVARRESVRPWVIEGLAAVLGLTSAVAGIAITVLIGYGLGLQIAEFKGSRDSFIYLMTEPAALCYFLSFAMVPIVPGIAGLLVARMLSGEARRASLAGMAARFSMLGIGLAAIIVVMVAVGALCRRVMWP